MKLMPLHKIAVPSPSVLSFLRHALEPTSAPCAALRGQRRGYATRSLGKRANTGAKGGVVGSLGRGETASCRGIAIHQGPFQSLTATRSETTLLAAHRCSRNVPQISHNHAADRRAFSTTSSSKAWELFRRRKPREPRSIPPPPPLSEVMGDAPIPIGFESLGRMTRAANELKMRCTELDEHGNVTMVSGEFKKSELIAKYGLLPRDLRKIDSSLLPNILIRPTAILINLLHIRALIKHNRVLVFDAYGTTDSKSQSVFMYDLDSKLRQKESAVTGNLAYEFRALEAVLISVTLSLEKEFEGVSEPVMRVLMELEEDIDRDKLRYLLVYSKKLGSFEQKARLVRDALSELLDADDDLSAMYLSEKAAGKMREEDDHTEVEMLLESYHKVADEIVQAAENLVSSIRNTEEIVKAILDANRNSLMLLDLRFSILTLALTAGTFVAALYGMNLKNFIEESDFGFWGVSAWCTVFGCIVAVYGIRKLNRVQRLSMWGHGGDKNIASTKGSWGIGAWGGKSRDPYGAAEAMGVPRLRAGESLGDLIQRERALARRLAKAEAHAEEVARKGTPGVGKLRYGN